MRRASHLISDSTSPPPSPSAGFFEHYKNARRHTGIALHTPAHVHFGLAEVVREKRRGVLHAATPPRQGGSAPRLGRRESPTSFGSIDPGRSSWSPQSSEPSVSHLSTASAYGEAKVTTGIYGFGMTTIQRARTEVYVCAACETTSPRWVGRCQNCGEWNTFGPVAASPPVTSVARAVPLRAVPADGAHPLPTGVSELDRVMAGGGVGGSVTLLFGPPGIGKSTLLFQVLSSVSATGVDVLLASAEESLTQVGGRASRLGPVPPHLLALEGHDVGAIEQAVARHRPALVVVDLLQSVSDPTPPQPAGSLSQVRASVERLTRMAKTSGVPLLLVGHVTKDGDLAGPRAVEHLVDTVLSFDGDRHHALRVLTSVKHRFGPTGEVGIFEMGDDGLRAVPDPGPLMLGDRMAGVPGSVVVPVLQGRRPLLVEVQALLGPGNGGGTGPPRPH